MENVPSYLFTAENAEGAEMTEKERLNRITESIIGAAIEGTRPEGGTAEAAARGLSGSE